jgi:molybdenum cofactor cytidylyltransferase
LLNQADDEALLPAARDVARLLIARGLRRVVLGAVRTSQPVRELALAGRSGARVTAVVLAAGLGRRMGRVKLALPLSGQPILRHVVDAALASEADEVLVVLGHHAAELRALLPANDRLRTVLNPDYASGQSSSVRAAVGALPATADAALFLLGDQPTLTPAILNTVIRAFAAHPTPVVQPEYRGAPGHPVLFAHALFSELLAVSGDEGGRDVLRRHLAERSAVALDCDTPGDVDTAADYESLRDRFRSN